MKKWLFLPVLSLFFSCEMDYIYKVPLVETYAPESVSGNAAKLGGLVYAEGGLDVIEYGVVISNSENPTISDQKIVMGSRLGGFFDIIEGLNSGSLYHYRFFATNKAGTGYGQDFSFETTPEAPCQPAVMNNVSFNGSGSSGSNVSEIDYEPQWSDEQKFWIRFYGTQRAVKVYFHETGAQLPRTGQYTTGSYFSEETSQNEVVVYGDDSGWGFWSASAPEGEHVYVVNQNGNITLTFCDTQLGTLSLYGKVAYQY